MKTFTANIKTTTATEALKTAIEGAITRLAEEEFEKAKKEMVERLDKHKDELVAGIVLRFSSAMSLYDYGQSLRITIEKKDLK